MSNSAPRLPLTGVRVLDLTQVVAGPYCTMMLADMGADVVKVERPSHGDDLRRTVPYKGRAGHEDYFNALNRSKRSVALDLKKTDDRETALKLLERADVLVENFSPGTAARLGLGWDIAQARNPKLIYCSLSGFGQTGPYRNRPALDPMIQAVSGLMSVTGLPDGEPTMVGAPVADVIAGMFAAYAIVNALRLVARQGEGQYIDVSMQDALLATVGTRMGETLQAGISPSRLGNENPLRVPANTYRTRDGLYITMMVHNEEQWRPFCEAMEKLAWLEHPRMKTMALRVRNRAEVNEVVAQRFAERDSAYWHKRLEEFGIPYAPVNDYAQALADPQVEHRGIVREIEHPRSGAIKVVGPPWKMSRTPVPMRTPPLLGEHNDEILREWLNTALASARG